MISCLKAPIEKRLSLYTLDNNNFIMSAILNLSLNPVCEKIEKINSFKKLNKSNLDTSTYVTFGGNYFVYPVMQSWQSRSSKRYKTWNCMPPNVVHHNQRFFSPFIKISSKEEGNHHVIYINFCLMYMEYVLDTNIIF